MAILNPFQLLEINVISAQDLETVSRKMKTYATAWVNSGRKLTSSVDHDGHNNPTWNDKFVFRVDEEFLRQDTSAVMIEIHNVNWFRNTLVGSVRVLVGNLIPPRTQHHHHRMGMRFVALQVRRPSGRPQGILNIGVALLDSSMRSMPLYTQASAVGIRDLMEDEHLNHHQNNNNDDDDDNDTYSDIKPPPPVKPILRRTKSERSERVTFDNASVANSSLVAVPQMKEPLDKEGSILSISEAAPAGFMMKKKSGKASSVISGAELREKPNRRRGKKGKAGSSVVSDSVYSKDSGGMKQFRDEKKNESGDGGEKIADKEKVEGVNVDVSTTRGTDEKFVEKPKGRERLTTVVKRPNQKFIPYEFEGPKPNQKFILGVPKKASSVVWSDSEVGPSPSEVAAAMAEKRYPLDDNQSSVLDGWSVDESVEGLRSKLDRWRTQLPPIYDRSAGGDFSSSYRSSSKQQHSRRHTDGGSGLFSCFGNIAGYECQCVCGKPPGKKSHSARFTQSPSIGSRSFF